VDFPLIVRKVDNPVWLAPEILAGHMYDHRSDIYSYSVILWELSTRMKFLTDLPFISDISEYVISGDRPAIPLDLTPVPFQKVITLCWEQKPNLRPKMSVVLEILSTITNRMIENCETQNKLYDQKLAEQWELDKIQTQKSTKVETNDINPPTRPCKSPESVPKIIHDSKILNSQLSQSESYSNKKKNSDNLKKHKADSLISDIGPNKKLRRTYSKEEPSPDLTKLKDSSGKDSKHGNAQKPKLVKQETNSTSVHQQRELFLNGKWFFIYFPVDLKKASVLKSDTTLISAVDKTLEKRGQTKMNYVLFSTEGKEIPQEHFSQPINTLPYEEVVCCEKDKILTAEQIKEIYKMTTK